MPETTPLDYSEKLALLTERGYSLVGDLPDSSVRWPSLNAGPSFLLIKDNEYYECNARFLSKDNIKLDEDNEPLPGCFLRKIDYSKNYIYALINIIPVPGNPSKQIFILREDASKGGHAFICGPYKDPQKASVTAGEIYFKNNKILLINPKSGTFRNDIRQAYAELSTLLKDVNRTIFHEAVEEDEVAVEVERRSNLERDLTRSFSGSSLSSMCSISSFSSSSSSSPQSTPFSTPISSNRHITFTIEQNEDELNILKKHYSDCRMM
jgi:hypothetical protein